MAKSPKVEAEENTALATVSTANNLPSVYEYDDEDAGAGFENSETADFAVPFYHVLQATSKAVKECEDGSVRAGMIYNSVTQIAYDADSGKNKPGRLVIPCAYTHNFNEWRPRDSGGGFVGIHEPHSPFVRDIVAKGEFGKYKTPDGNDLVDTYTMYCLSVEENEGEFDFDTVEFDQVVIPHTSTKIAAFRNTASKMRMMTIPGTRKSFPIYSHIWRVQTKSQVNKGETSFNILWTLAFGSGRDAAAKSQIPTGSLLFEAAKKMYRLCADGEMQAKTQESMKKTGGEQAQEDNGFHRSSGAEDVSTAEGFGF